MKLRQFQLTRKRRMVEVDNSSGFAAVCSRQLPWFRQPLIDVLFVAGWLMIAAFVTLNISAIRVMRRAGNDCEAGSGFGSPRHGRPLLLHAQSALPRQHYTCTGDWTSLRDRVVFAA